VEQVPSLQTHRVLLPLMNAVQTCMSHTEALTSVELEALPLGPDLLCKFIQVSSFELIYFMVLLSFLMLVYLSICVDINIKTSVLRIAPLIILCGTLFRIKEEHAVKVSEGNVCT
jgi:hypothetical protein